MLLWPTLVAAALVPSSPGARAIGAARPRPIVSAAPPPSRPAAPSALLAPIVPTGVLVLLHVALRRSLPLVGIEFPASIIGMLGGFAVLCCLPRPAAQRLERFFEPACRLLREWLAAIFSPGFTALPLTMPAMRARDLGGFVALLVAGFVATTASTAAIATSLAPRRSVPFDDGGSDLASPDAGPPPALPNPFPRAQQGALVSVMLACAAVHVFVLRDPYSLQLSLLAATLAAFSVASTTTPPSLKIWLHPFVTTSLCTLGACAAIGAASHVGAATVVAAYSAPAGAGGALTQLMGPAVISFAFQLYAYRAQLRRRSVQIVGTALTGSLAAMLTSAAAARAAGLAPILRLALISRNTISALAIEICALLVRRSPSHLKIFPESPLTTPLAPRLPSSQGVQPAALGLLAAFVTGLLAFPLGKATLAWLNVRDPATRGLALAGAAHGGGLLSLADEPEAFPFAALMMNLSAACAVILVSVPVVRKLLMRVALG